MFNGYKMPFRRRYAKSRRRRPKARRRVDKVQDRRISRLENATEKKFAQAKPVQVLVSSQVTNTENIYEVIPQAVVGDGTGTQASTILGNQMSLRNVKVGFQLTNTLVTGADIRVMFFWNVCPRTWSTTATSLPPTSTAVAPSWPQLLHGFVAGPTSTNSRANMVAGRQLISSSNESPIKVLSDRIIHLGGKESSNSSKKLVFSKSYKDLKLCYNNFAGATGQALKPVNRQLYMAILPCHTNEETGSEEGSIYLSYASQMHYTDA